MNNREVMRKIKKGHLGGFGDGLIKYTELWKIFGAILGVSSVAWTVDAMFILWNN